MPTNSCYMAGFLHHGSTGILGWIGLVGGVVGWVLSSGNLPTSSVSTHQMPILPLVPPPGFDNQCLQIRLNVPGHPPPSHPNFTYLLLCTQQWEWIITVCNHQKGNLTNRPLSKEKKKKRQTGKVHAVHFHFYKSQKQVKASVLPDIMVVTGMLVMFCVLPLTAWLWLRPLCATVSSWALVIRALLFVIQCLTRSEWMNESITRVNVLLQEILFQRSLPGDQGSSCLWNSSYLWLSLLVKLSARPHSIPSSLSRPRLFPLCLLTPAALSHDPKVSPSYQWAMSSRKGAKRK